MKTKVYSNSYCLVCGIEIIRLSGRQKYCKPCYKVVNQQKARQWEKDNPERVNELKRKAYPANKEKQKSSKRKSLYRITQSSFDAMLADQDNKCAICRSRLEVPFVDHDHTTKKVRELLCRFCNAFIGLAKEDPVILLGAVQYLKKHKETNV